jgi:hypothetical protein
MKASEIMLNNYVKDHLGRVLKVVGLKDDNVYLVLSNKEKIRYNIKTIQGLELTEEILLKCGFVIGGSKQWLFINLDKKDECYLYFNPLGKGIAIDQEGKECSFEIDLNYLHQLQNLYFALTNEELTINL